MRPSHLLVPAWLAICALTSLCAAQRYTITDLGVVSGSNYSVAQAINATGQITGASGKDGSDQAQVFLYSAGKMQGLGTLGGHSGLGNGINSSGQIAGYSENSKGTYRAFISSASSLVD